MVVVMRGGATIVLMRPVVDEELGCRHAGAQDARGRHRGGVGGEAAERAAELLERQAGVDERAENHVS